MDKNHLLVHRNRSLITEAAAARANTRRQCSRGRIGSGGEANEWGRQPLRERLLAWSCMLEGLRPDRVRWEPALEVTGPLL